MRLGQDRLERARPGCDGPGWAGPGSGMDLAGGSSRDKRAEIKEDFSEGLHVKGTGKYILREELRIRIWTHTCGNFICSAKIPTY